MKVKDLTVSYGDGHALWDVSFSAKKGELIGIIGPNGAGKSTLIKAILEFIKPVSGSVHFFNGKTLKEARERIVYVPQVQSIDWSFPITALEVVVMGDYHKRKFLRWPTKASRQKAIEILNMLKMGDLKDRHISELSGGQKQKLFIARALMQEGDVYFFDEPFSGIDHTTQSELIELFRKLADEGKTLFVVHHDLSSVESIFDRVLILNTYLVACGKCEEVFTYENLQKAYGYSETILSKLLDASKVKKSGRG